MKQSSKRRSHASGGPGSGGRIAGFYLRNEIRILNDDLTTKAIVAQQYLNDGVAIRSARRFADSNNCEVWRGLTCVYHTRPMAEH